MAKRDKPSVVEETPLPTEEVTPSEPAAPAAVEETKPPEEGVTEPEPKEAEKPSVTELLAGLSDDERDTIYKKVFGERLQRAEQSARDAAWAKMQAGQRSQVEANQGLQDTLKNLDGADDDNKRAGHVQAYADWYAQSASQRWASEALDNLRESLGVSREEHDEITLRLHQAAARESRAATFGDYVKHVTGERFMPKGDFNKQIQAEVKAAMAEQRGKSIENQEAPVSLGTGEPLKGTPTIEDFAGMTRKQRSEMPDEKMKAMVREEYEARGIPYPL